MTHWNPQTYLQFGDERLRPALDLLARVQCDDPKHIIDLGCGPGNVTALLQQRWQKATLSGIDSSPDMLAKAQTAYRDINWQQSDIAHWTPQQAPDLLFSNACLHWLNDHENLFSRLIGLLPDGGVLAVQMPNNFNAPTHQAIRDVLGKDHPLSPSFPVASPEAYFNWLAPFCQSIDIWETTYLHILEGDNPVADWTKGAALRPILDGLKTPEERKDFETDYRRLILKAYPPGPDGKTLLPFKRLFIIAQKG